MSRHIQGLTVLGLALLVLVSWPLVLSPFSTIPGQASLEATEHLWLLWLASESGGLTIETDLVSSPDGFQWILGDPLNLIWFVPAHWLGGPALGFNMVHWGNLAVAGVAAIWLGQEVLGHDRARAPLTLCAALALPALSGGLLTGMTEAQTVGWAILSLAALHRAIRTGILQHSLIAGGLCGLTAWGGPYPILHLALLAPIFIGVALWRHRPDPLRGALTLCRIAGPAGLLALPIAQAIFSERSANQPGSSDHSAEILADPSRVENLTLGADPLQLIIPTTTDHDFEAYLGSLMLLLAVVGTIHLKRRALPLLVPALIGLILSIGLYMHIAGEPIAASSGVWLAPAGWLTEQLSALGRAPRWYRMALLGGLMLAPLAATGIQTLTQLRPQWSRPLLLLLPVLLLCDGLLLAPIQWPRPLLDARAPAGADQLQGPLLELPLSGQQGDGPPPQEMGLEVPPPVRSLSIRDGLNRIQSRLRSAFSPPAPVGLSGGVDAFRSRSLLWQAQHEQGLGTNPFLGAGPEATDQAGVAIALAIEKARREQRSEQIDILLLRAQEQGFQSILFYPGPHSEPLESLLRQQLGEPSVDESSIKSWPLTASP